MITYLCIGLELLRIAIEKAGYTGRIQIGMDVAASEFCKDKKYDLDFKNPQSDPAHWVRIKLHSSSFSVQIHLANGGILNHVSRASFKWNILQISRNLICNMCDWNEGPSDIV